MQTQTPGPASATAPTFRMVRSYLKRSTLDASKVAKFLGMAEAKPRLEIHIGVLVEPGPQDSVEVVSIFDVQTYVGEELMCEAHIEQAGMFELHGFEPQHRHQVERTVCPQLTFPYVRYNLSDLFVRAGLPPVNLDEINFMVLYQQQLEHQAQQAAQGQGGDQPPAESAGQPGKA